MSAPFMGEIRLISFDFPPHGWAFCNGQLMPVQQNQALFSILGTQYGGDGVVTFALPNLRGRMPIHQGNGYFVGNAGGETAHTLTGPEMPQHVHVVAAQTVPNATTPTGAVFAGGSTAGYGAAGEVTMSAAAIGNAGSSQPHENRPPFLVLNYIIALQGIFPSQN